MGSECGNKRRSSFQGSHNFLLNSFDTLDGTVIPQVFDANSNFLTRVNFQLVLCQYSKIRVKPRQGNRLRTDVL